MQGYAGELDDRASSRYTPEMLEGADKMNLDGTMQERHMLSKRNLYPRKTQRKSGR